MPRNESPYRVPLRQIPPDGLDLRFDLSGPFAGKALAGTEAQTGSATIDAEVNLQRVGHDVYARGRVVGTLTVPCSRCAKEAALAVDAPFELTFVPPGSDGAADSGDEEVELAAGDLDVLPYDGEGVDLEEILREQLLLSIPIAPLCREACQGLCPRCGHDRNEGPCPCPPEPPTDDRWAALKNVKV